jgi:hypothetical protein
MSTEPNRGDPTPSGSTVTGTGDVPARAYNDVMMGDGSAAWLRPIGSVSRITDPLGHVSCLHTDATPCDRSGHETLTTYYVEPQLGNSYAPPSFFQDGVYRHVVSAIGAEIDRWEAERWWRRTRLWARLFPLSDRLFMAAIRSWDPTR